MTLPLMEPVVLAPPPCANASVDASSNAGSTATSKWNLRRFMNSSLSRAFRSSEPSTRIITLTAHLEQQSFSVQQTIQVLVRWSVETAGFGMSETDRTVRTVRTVRTDHTVGASDEAEREGVSRTRPVVSGECVLPEKGLRRSDVRCLLWSGCAESASTRS